MFIYARHIMAILGAESEVVILGTSYLRYILPGFAVFLTTIPLSGALRGAGDAVTPMKISIVLHVVKLIGNWILIYGKMGCPALALDGAAISWTLSRAVAGMLFFYTLRDRACPVSIFPIAPVDFLRVDTTVVKRLLRIAVPAILERVALSLGMVVYGSMIADLGTEVYAAFNIANTTESLSYMPGQSFQTAASATVGHYVGAGEYGGAKRSVKEAAKMCIATMGTMALAFFLVPQYLVQMFTADPEIIRLSSMALRVAAFGQVPMGLAGICSGSLQGAGDTQAVMYVTLFSVWVVRLGVTYLLVNVGGLGLSGAWLAQVVDWLVRCGCLRYRFGLGQWEQVEV
jgi:putative MATE family efflux protein